jgi:hypothetical protein
MADLHGDHSQILAKDNPERGRLAKKKAQQEKAPSMQQRRTSVAKKIMQSSKLPETYEEYSAMKDKPFLPSADVEAGLDLEKTKPVALKSREQATKDAASLAMRESEQQKKLDKFTSIPDSFGRELSQFVTGDEYLMGGLMPSGLQDEAAIGAAGLALDSAAKSKALKDLEESAFDRGLKAFQQYGRTSREMMGDAERALRQAEAAAKKELKQLGYEKKLIDKLLKSDLSDESSEVLKLVKRNKAMQKWVATRAAWSAQDELFKAAGKTAARKASARKAADDLTRAAFRAIGKNNLSAIAKTVPAVGAVYSFLEQASSVATRSKELPNQLAQNARAMKRPLQKRDLEPSVLGELERNPELRDSLYERGVLSAKLYDSFGEPERVFEGE